MTALEAGKDYLAQLKLAQSETLAAICIESGTMFGDG